MRAPSDKGAHWLKTARESPDSLGQALEACRGYLLLVAQRELGPQLNAKGGASDLVQETLLDAVRDFARFRGDSEGELLRWLRRLLLNNLADFTRQFRETSKRQIERELRLQSVDSSVQRVGELATSQPSPSSQLRADEERDAIRNVVDKLPEAYRRVIVLRYQDGRSFEEIARVLGVTANAARKLLLRAVERVQRELEGPR
jgi:RNA polymerase sigma-70 factor (ECF subfamily)